MSDIRPVAVAGTFYPASSAELRQTLVRLLAEKAPADPVPAPKALIVPHAGYVYSGAVAASAYARLGGLRDRIRRVVLLGPAHRIYVRGLALPGVARFASPLGETPLDPDGMAALADLPQVCVSTEVHRLEHSLEVQLPFLQHLLGDFRLLPLLVGEASAAEVAEALERLWGGDETLIVISSDLSHFLTDAAAKRLDATTIDAILAQEPHLDQRQACGATPVNGFLVAARRHDLRARRLDACNSAAAGGDTSRVVGYAAFAFEPDADADQTADDEGSVLLKLARAEIAAGLGLGAPESVTSKWLDAPGASFVTLTRHGELRGCIGTLEAHRPLALDVRENAVAAAFRDPRFPPVSGAEYDVLRVEVSVLSRAEALMVGDEATARAALRPHVDGVVFEYRHLRSTFLPQVWAQLPDPVEFLAWLKRKAGLPADFWSDEVRLSRYTVSKWREA